jgi:hypothetical protein
MAIDVSEATNSHIRFVVRSGMDSRAEEAPEPTGPALKGI